MELSKNGDYLTFGKVSFCAKALTKCKDEKRAHLKHLYVKDGEMAGTDGNRLHQAFDVDVPDGWYRVIKHNKSTVFIDPVQMDEYANYPDVNQVFDQKGRYKEFYVDFADYTIDPAYAKIIRAMDKHLILKHDYVSDLEGHEFDCLVFRSDSNRSWAPVIFQNGDKRAAIMPFKPRY